MKTYYRDFYGCTASIADRPDGSARLVIRLSNGKKMHNKIHKNRNAALAAWRRSGD